MNKTKRLVVSAILASWVLVLGMTQLGFIPIGPIRATTLHIPVLIAAICYDAKMGVFIGLIFGVYSLIQNMLRPTILSFAFLNPAVSILPRVMLPLIAYYVNGLLKKRKPDTLKAVLIATSILLMAAMAYSTYNGIVKEKIAGAVISVLLFLLLAAVVVLVLKQKTAVAPEFVSATFATIMHTVMVMGLIYLIYLNEYATALGIEVPTAANVILMTALVNGAPEAVIGGVIVGAVAHRKEKYDINR